VRWLNHEISRRLEERTTYEPSRPMDLNHPELLAGPLRVLCEEHKKGSS
jgi:hypothetical protein